MSRCGPGLASLGGAAPGGGGGPVPPEEEFSGQTLWEYDLANESSRAIVTGAISIDATTFGANAWTAQTAALGSMQFIAGTGLEYISAAVATTFTGIAVTAANVFIPLSTVYSVFGLDARAIIGWYGYFNPLTTAGAGTSNVGAYRIAADVGNGSNALVSANRGRATGVDVSNTQSTNGGATTTSSSYTSAPGPTADVVGVTMSTGNTFTSYCGVWNGAFETTPMTPMNEAAVGVATTFNALRNGVTRLFIAWPTNAAVIGHNPSTLRRLRLVYLGAG